MGTHELLEQALRLRAEEKFILVEGILNSLDEPDRSLDAVWADEAERRIEAYREGRLEVIPMDEVFQDET
jgi:putative addiction module component (TIGR02574 family)